MKKYLGSQIDMFAAITAPLFICLPLPFAISAFSSGVDVARIVLLIGCALCSAIWGLYLKQIRFQIYSYGRFLDKTVKVKTLFSGVYCIEYSRCFGCGIGFYTHGFLNKQIGIKIYYIFLSYDQFDEQYRSRINLWRPTKTRIKVKFSKELYNYLIAVLPKTQSRALKQDYARYITGDGAVCSTGK